MFEIIGSSYSSYGGKVLDLNLVPEKSVIISAGIGENINFELLLMQLKKCKVIGIDPTEKAGIFIAKTTPKGFILIDKALAPSSGKKIKLYKNINPQHVSESVLEHHTSVSKKEFHIAETISLVELLETYKNNISVIKLDIEGAEFELLNDEQTLKSLKLYKIPQFVCEFHHFCSGFTKNDTKTIIDKLKNIGYVHWIPKTITNPYDEMTFVHEGVLQ